VGTLPRRKRESVKTREETGKISEAFRNGKTRERHPERQKGPALFGWTELGPAPEKNSVATRTPSTRDRRWITGYMSSALI
jgi:hypothetical protein